METSITTGLQWFSAVSFLGFGLACLYSARMVAEFDRYGLGRQRVMVGLLEVVGAIGLLIGFKVSWVGALAAAGLGLLMWLGFMVRLKIRDGFLRSLPALLYCGINIFVAVRLWRAFLVLGQ